MIEKRYTGIAKQGADVVANPTLDGSEQALNSIRINGENFKIEGGGSGKLKLVEEGTFNSNASGQMRVVFNIDASKLEEEKYYLVTAYCGAFGGYTTTIIRGDVYNSSPITWWDVNDCPVLATCSISDKTINIEAVSEEEIYTDGGELQIYELEFGGSSGGGSSDSNKLKLVAEGQLIYNEGDFFELPYQLENGKSYLIQMWQEGYCLAMFKGMYLNDEFYSSVTKNGSNDTFVCLSIFGQEMYFMNQIQNYVNTEYQNCSYKIYELPFSL